jgi:hypothetical protein
MIFGAISADQVSLIFNSGVAMAMIARMEVSGKRDSNPRPSAWEADALPTELFPRECCYGYSC